MPLEFDPQAAMEYATAMARPRLVGSAGAKSVADELAGRLETFGYHVEKEPFRFRNAVIMAIDLEILAGMVLAGLALAGIAPFPVSALGMIVLLLTFRRVMRAGESAAILPESGAGSFLGKCAAHLGMTRAADNLVAALPGATATAGSPRLYLVAHYDTKSQPLPIPVRIILFVIVFIASIVFVGLALLTGLSSNLVPAASWAGAILIAAGIPLLVNTIGNRSPGAIDNASGVGVVAHLAERLAQSPELRSRLNWTVLLTSGEEFGLMGAAAYIKRHGLELREQAEKGSVFVLNFDGVGTAGRLYYDARGGRKGRGALALCRLAEEAAKARGIPLRQTRLVGALLDHIPFTRLGLDALSFLIMGRASLAVHTRHDTVALLDPQGFDQAGQVVVEIINRLVNAE